MKPNQTRPRRRSAITVLVAFAVTTMALSPRFTQAEGARMSNVDAAVARSPGLGITASADDVVVIPENALNAVVWYALSTRGAITQPVKITGITRAADDIDDEWDARLRKVERVFFNYLSSRWVTLTRGTPEGSGPALLKLFGEYEARIGRDASGDITNPNIRTLGDCISAFFEVASRDPAYRELARQVYAEMRQQSAFRDEDGRPAPDADSLIHRELRNFNFEGAIIRNHTDSVLALINEAKTNAAVREMLQKRAAPGTPPLLGFDAKKWILENVSDPISQQLADLKQQNGDLQIGLDELTALTKSEFDKINASLVDMRGILVDIDKQQKDILLFLKDQQAREKAEALAAAKAKEHERKLKAAESGLFIVSTLIGLKYPERARQISVVGHSLIQVGETYRQWMKAVAGLSASDKIFNLSTVIATGNVLGAVMNVASLFGDKEPSPEQMILQEIARLRQEIGQLRSEMHDRFDRVDRGINLIFTTMHDRFNQIDVQLGRVIGDLHELRLSLAALSTDLHRIELNNVAFLDSLGRRPLLNTINGALGYRVRTGNPMPYEPAFVDAENVFYTWGATTAFDALAAGPQQRDYRDSQVFDELESLPLDSNLNYLNGWLLANGHPAMSSKRLPGMRDWLFAVRAYATLGLENPDHLSRINRSRIEALDAVGQELESALSRISAPIAVSGTITHSAVLSGALGYYTDNQLVLNQAMAELELAYLVELTSTLGLNRDTPFDLFGGPQQTIQHKTGEMIEFSCAATAPVLATPVNLGRVAVGYSQLMLGDYLRLPVDPVKVCLSAEWINPSVECFMGNCRMLANLSATLNVYAGGALMGQQIYTDNTRRALAIGTVALQYAYLNWTELKGGFEADTLAGAQPIIVSDEPLSKAVALLEEALAGYQHQLYARMVNALSPGGPLAAAGKELAGGKKLIAAYATLGMPNALEQDEVLHSLLFGSRGLLDDVVINATFALSATQPISGLQLAVNQRLALQLAGAERATALRELLEGYVRQASPVTGAAARAAASSDMTQVYVEHFTAIADARRDLRLVLAFSTPGAGRRLFLPVVSR